MFVFTSERLRVIALNQRQNGRLYSRQSVVRRCYLYKASYWFAYIML